MLHKPVHKYIQRRGNAYHFRWQVPADLRQVFGVTELTCSLRTPDCLQASVKAGRLIVIVARINQRNGKAIHLWCSQDALALKLIAQQLESQLSLSPACAHVKGHGGLKQCVVGVAKQLSDYRFVCKTDVKHYYQSISQPILLKQLYDQVSNKTLRRYLYQIICRTVEYGGTYRDMRKGIGRGCPISPLLGALYLKQLDDAFNQPNLYYRRYMDDIVILTKTRWQNRRAVKQLNQIFNQQKLSQHPDKIFIGRIDEGFDFLAYHFSPKGLQLATITVRKHVERRNRLYEQQITKKATPQEVALVLGNYTKRWHSWCAAGLAGLKLASYDESQRNLIMPVQT